jgi:uncharacterized glyoxalase superfamily protein PhnB
MEGRLLVLCGRAPQGEEKMAVQPIPDGFHTVTPYLVVEEVPRLIEFLAAAFGGEETARTTAPDGRIMHAQVKIGDSVVMMGGATEEFPALQTAIYLYVEDTDATYERAVQAGGESLFEPDDQFYGDRMAGVRGPAGNFWWIATHVEGVDPDQVERRAAERERTR